MHHPLHPGESPCAVLTAASPVPLCIQAHQPNKPLQSYCSRGAYPRLASKECPWDAGSRRQRKTAWLARLHASEVWIAAGLAKQGLFGGKAVQKAEL